MIKIIPSIKQYFPKDNSLLAEDFSQFKDNFYHYDEIYIKNIERWTRLEVFDMLKMTKETDKNIVISYLYWNESVETIFKDPSSILDFFFTLKYNKELIIKLLTKKEYKKTLSYLSDFNKEEIKIIINDLSLEIDKKSQEKIYRYSEINNENLLSLLIFISNKI